MIAAAWFLAGCAVTAAVIAYALLAAVRPCPCPECEADRYERQQGRKP
jgi:uncharacterized lipoprotein YmbA